MPDTNYGSFERTSIIVRNINRQSLIQVCQSFETSHKRDSNGGNDLLKDGFYNKSVTHGCREPLPDPPFC